MMLSLRPAGPLALAAAALVASSAISMGVAAERDKLDKLRVAMARDVRDIRNLQAELRTRARLPELQRWNDEVLGLASPIAGQYLADPVQLANYRAPEAAKPPALVYAEATPTPAAPSPVRQVAFEAPVQLASVPARVAAPPVRAASAPGLDAIGDAIEATAIAERGTLTASLR